MRSIDLSLVGTSAAVLN